MIISNRDKICSIVEKHITPNVNRPTKGWTGKILSKLSGAKFNQHAAQISLGKKLESVFVDISRLGLGDESYRRIIAGYGVSEEEARQYIIPKEKKEPNVSILTRMDKSELSNLITVEFNKFIEEQKRNRDLRLDDNTLLEISNRIVKDVSLQTDIYTIKSDFCPFSSGYSIVEIKTTGDTDSGKTPQTIRDCLITPFVVLQGKDRKAFLGIVSNNYEGEDEWGGIARKYLSKDNILIEEQLWSMFSPRDVSFCEFKTIVELRLEAIYR